MAQPNPKYLFAKLNGICRSALAKAVSLCQSRSHFEVEIEHWLYQLLDVPNNDLPLLFEHLNIDIRQVKRDLEGALKSLKSGNNREPSLSSDIYTLIREAWLLGSIECQGRSVRSGYLLGALLSDDKLRQWLSRSSLTLLRISGDTILKTLQEVLPQLSSYETEIAEQTAAPSGEGPSKPDAALSETPALDQFTINLTERARQGKIDPVIGRDAEIRLITDILTRRRQNNPILTGEAGVGKTAVVEGLALQIVAGEVPPPLRTVELRTLDLGLLQAGAGVKGEFENRLKSVIEEVKKSPTPIILFIDEAHTLIGAGGAAGQNDAANLLKPALARGELRTIAATTFAEYKKYFETDAALKRRFQQVKVDEPNEPNAVRMLRGLSQMLEKHHGVRILDDAITGAVKLSMRYMPDRQLPDKSISLLDTVCARVSLSQSATPAAVADAQCEVEQLKTEIEFLERESRAAATPPERLTELRQKLPTAEATLAKLQAQLAEESKLVSQIRELRSKMETAEQPADEDRAQLATLGTQLTQTQGETPLVYPVVDSQAVAEVVSRLTGVPLGKMVRDELETVLNLASRLGERVVGQSHALDAIAQRIRTARADLGDPRRPLGVFLLVGPSGVGKTETAMALADLLYGGDRNMVVVNMSEYKESHKVSRLVGTSKGYVGYGEGGVLTNAVKNRPHSVVLLDEVEKAHESVQEIFYQVFDKGVLQNDNGEDVNFKNTIILLTSNAGTNAITQLCSNPAKRPDPSELATKLHPELLKVFKPALLGRMTVVPYYPLAEEVLRSIIELKLKQIGERLKQNYKASFVYTPAVVSTVLSRCTEVETGARNVDHILTGTLLPALSQEVLVRLANRERFSAVTVDIGAASQFTYRIE